MSLRIQGISVDPLFVLHMLAERHLCQDPVLLYERCVPTELTLLAKYIDIYFQVDWRYENVF